MYYFLYYKVIEEVGRVFIYVLEKIDSFVFKENREKWILEGN